MKITILILSLLGCIHAHANDRRFQFDFFGAPISFSLDTTTVQRFESELNAANITQWYTRVDTVAFAQVEKALATYKLKSKPDDWIFYQLIRKSAEQFSPKKENYTQYTLYKWLLLTRLGYDAILSLAGNRLMFYVRSEENAYNIPSRRQDGKQYVCLNFHDYSAFDISTELITEIKLPVPANASAFSYRISRLPAFTEEAYVEKDLKFTYEEKEYFFRIKLSNDVKSIFANYPVVDYDSYMNIPLSRESYGTLIPILRKNIKGMNQRNGIDFLMRFTRYAFDFEPDTLHFGAEKRLSPEQTLLYAFSDCEDRVALFFYLVKEIYDLPMIVLAYPRHVTIAVALDKPIGDMISHNGMRYSYCEPTPQQTDTKIGEMLPQLRQLKYEITYSYTPSHRQSGN